jgi:hypothetical protein
MSKADLQKSHVLFQKANKATSVKALLTRIIVDA